MDASAYPSFSLDSSQEDSRACSRHAGMRRPHVCFVAFSPPPFGSMPDDPVPEAAGLSVKAQARRKPRPLGPGAAKGAYLKTTIYKQAINSRYVRKDQDQIA